MFDIRDGSIKDLASISSIELVCFKKPWTEKELTYELTENPVSHYLVCEDDSGQIVGFIDFWITFDSATIAQIAVLPECRRLGIAHSLLLEALKDCYAKNVIYMTLEVRAGNIAARNLYKKCEFKEITVKPHYYDDGEDAIYMLRRV